MKCNERDRTLFWSGFFMGFAVGILYVVVLTLFFHTNKKEERV